MCLTIACILLSTISLSILYTPSLNHHSVKQLESSSHNLATNGYIIVNVSEAKQMIESNPNLVIVDVRTREEYESGHIENAVSIPFNEFEERIDELNKEKETLVYCLGLGCWRSPTASQILVDNGFVSVYNMPGGITAWRDAGYWIEIIHRGDLTIVGTQTFVIENCTYIQEGNIHVYDWATLIIRNAVLQIDNAYPAQYEIYIHNYATIEIQDSEVTSEFGSGLYFIDHVDANIYGSWFNNLWICCGEDATVTIACSKFIEIQVSGRSEVKIRESEAQVFDSMDFSGNVFFDNVTIVHCGGFYNSQYFIYGIVEMGTFIGGWVSSNVTRNYNVVARDMSDNPMENVELTLFGQNYEAIWNGNTDTLGKANFNVTFTDSNYTDTLKLEAVKGNFSATMNVSFLSDTPLILTLGTYNVAVIDLTPFKTVIGQGYSLSINVTVENQGDYTETFNITAYANETVIDIEETTLASGSSTVITFTWNTSGFSTGSYTVIAIADQVPGETDLEDNIFIDGTITISEFIHDIAVLDVESSKTVVCEGYSMNINVTVENQGDVTETFNLTVYANETEIETKQITLENGSSTVITFTWNTAGFLKYQNYTISAQADPVPGEIDTDDNTFTGGIVTVVHPGDVNADKKVDMKDIGEVARVFGVNYPNPTFNPDYDFDGDGKMSMKDVAIAAHAFGFQW